MHRGPIINEKSKESGMKHNNTKGTESGFQESSLSESGVELLHIIRESFRAPGGEFGTVSVQIGDQHFDVVNIGTHGIGILLSQGDAFSINEELHSIDLIWQGNSFTLQGKVVHISPTESGTYLCGIELTRVDEASDKQLHEHLERHRSALFEKK
jgi:hypothetical protein